MVHVDSPEPGIGIGGKRTRKNRVNRKNRSGSQRRRTLKRCSARNTALGIFGTRPDQSPRDASACARICHPFFAVAFQGLLVCDCHAPSFGDPIAPRRAPNLCVFPYFIDRDDMPAAEHCQGSRKIGLGGTTTLGCLPSRSHHRRSAICPAKPTNAQVRGKISGGWIQKMHGQTPGRQDFMFLTALPPACRWIEIFRERKRRDEPADCRGHRRNVYRSDRFR